MVPSSIPDDVLVETDFLFFMDVDEREGFRHRIQFDVDGDGFFEGPDDLSTSWLTQSCELDQNGSKVDMGCIVAEPFLLGPQNGIAPGNISMRHQVESNSTISDEYFSVFLGKDSHLEKTPEIQSPNSQLSPDNIQKDLLVVVLFSSVMGILVILPQLKPNKK